MSGYAKTAPPECWRGPDYRDMRDRWDAGYCLDATAHIPAGSCRGTELRMSLDAPARAWQQPMQRIVWRGA